MRSSQRPPSPPPEPAEPAPTTLTWTVAGSGTAAPPAPGDGLATGTALGRYLVLERLGTGATGEVYAAWDRELDRKVALKLLRPERADAAARERLLDEARALARLSHPHVVTVHDVGVVEGLPEAEDVDVETAGVGDADSEDGETSETRTAAPRVFLALELVPGRTVGAWSAAERRPWRRVLERFLALGRGLAAIHAAGLVHRDVSPSNLMVTRDGRAVVTDLGLARPVPEGRETDADGRVVGTPGFVAPECLDGTAATPASDQYAFCAVLSRALLGHGPRRSDERTETDSGGEREAEAPPTRGRVPAGVRRAIERGLAAEPSERHGSLDELLAALERAAAAPRRRTVAAAVTVLALVLVGAGLYAGAEGPAAALCRGGSSAWDEVWTPRRAAAGEAAFEATDTPWAGAAWERVAGRIRSWGTDWAAAHREACEATHRTGEQSPALLDRRMACLDRRLERVDALVAALGEVDADADALERLEDLRLPALEPCADADRLLARVAPPEEPETRRRVADIEVDLARLEALYAVGRLEDAEALAPSLLERARAVGHAPTLAAVAEAVGETRVELGRWEDAEEALHEALPAALAGGDDVLLAEAAARLVWTAGYGGERFAEAERWGRLAEAALERVGGDAQTAEVLANHRGVVLRLSGRHEEAVELFADTLERAEARAGETNELAHVLVNQADALAETGRYDEAEVALERALELRRGRYGEDHPGVALALGNLAVVRWRRGDAEGALELQRQELAIRRRILPDDHPLLALSLANLAATLASLGRSEEALELDREALERRIAALGPIHREVAISHNNVAHGYRDLGRLDEALAGFERAVAVAEEAVGADHPLVAYPLEGAGRTLLDLGRPAEARERLERALAIRRAAAVAPELEAKTAWHLARALDGVGERTEARRLARQALEGFEASEADTSEQRAEVEAWLAETAG